MKIQPSPRARGERTSGGGAIGTAWTLCVDAPPALWRTTSFGIVREAEERGEVV
jgi:hypothetical protein